MTPQFKVDQVNQFWVVEVFYVTESSQTDLFSDWGFEEPFPEEVYQSMQNWCATTFKTWLTPRRARRMSYSEFHFRNKKDADWFMLYWSGVDIVMD